MNINESVKTVLRWGIASAGLISQDFCTALASFESKYHVFQAVGARNLSDAQKFAERFGFVSYYNSYDELCNDKLVDIVYVGSINTTHKEIALKAIAAGKHILCEKPACMTLKDLEEVLEAAKAKKVFFMEAMWTRHFPILAKLKKEIEENKAIGDLKFLSTNFMVPINHVDRLKDKKLGGGAILDIGIYTVQMATFFFNHEEPIKITASGHLMESGVDECCTITLLYPNQRIGQINISTNCGRMAKTFLVGNKGVAEIPDFSWCPTEYILNGEKYTDPLPPCGHTNFDGSVGLRFQAEAAREAISKGWLEHPTMSHNYSRHIMHIMEEANKQLGNIY